MARLAERLKALEAVKRVQYFMPLIIVVIDELTDSQKLEIAEAEKEGQKVVLIMRDDS